LAVALGVRTTYLIMDMPALPSGAVTDAMWAPLREALAHPGGVDREPGTPEGIARSLAAAVRLYHDNRYAELAAVLPPLLSDAGGGSLLLRSRVLQLAGSVLAQTRQNDSARVALEPFASRCRGGRERLGRRLLRGHAMLGAAA
jgi:hypothetical protein